MLSLSRNTRGYGRGLREPAVPGPLPRAAGPSPDVGGCGWRVVRFLWLCVTAEFPCVCVCVCCFGFMVSLWFHVFVLFFVLCVCLV